MSENLDWVDIRNIKRYGDPSTGGGGSWHPEYTEDNPPDFDNMEIFNPLIVFNSNNAWYVPKDGWYRIVCIGKAGTSGTTTIVNGYLVPYDEVNLLGGSGGSTGGIAISHLYLRKGETYNITVNTATSSFGSLLSAKAGESAQNSSLDGIFSNPFPGKGGTATGGNYINIHGLKGGQGTYHLIHNPQHTMQYSQDNHSAGGERSYTYSNNMGRIGTCYIGNVGGFCDYTSVPVISRYHFSYPGNSDITTHNLVDVVNKRVVYGSSGGYASPGVFPGCVFIETTNNV